MKENKRLHAVSVECKIPLGFPDVSMTPGVVEIKWVESWPRKETAPLRIRHFTNEQRIFLRKRWNARRLGGAWLLLYVVETHDIFLYSGDWAADHVGKADRWMLERHAVARGWTPIEEYLYACD